MSGRRPLPAPKGERDDLQAQAQSIGDNIAIEPWDWRYYADQVRMARHNLDEATIKPYFQLDRIIEASFETAQRLFGLSFKELKDFHAITPTSAPGRFWMRAATLLAPSSAIISRAQFQAQRRLDERLPLAGKAHRRHPPIIVNVMNFSKGAAGEPSLLSSTTPARFSTNSAMDCTACSNVTYPLLAGTAVSTDFVEPRSSTSTGCRNRTSCAAMQPITGPAKRFRKNCSSA